MWLAGGTKPGIASSVQAVAHHSHDLREKHGKEDARLPQHDAGYGCSFGEESGLGGAGV